MNDNPDVHGIIVQLPLDSKNPINSSLATNAVMPEKDVDGWAIIVSELCYCAMVFCTFLQNIFGTFFFVKNV